MMMHWLIICWSLRPVQLLAVRLAQTTFMKRIMPPAFWVLLWEVGITPDVIISLIINAHSHFVVTSMLCTTWYHCLLVEWLHTKTIVLPFNKYCSCWIQTNKCWSICVEDKQVVLHSLVWHSIVVIIQL